MKVIHADFAERERRPKGLKNEPRGGTHTKGGKKVSKPRKSKPERSKVHPICLGWYGMRKKVRRNATLFSVCEFPFLGFGVFF